MPETIVRRSKNWQFTHAAAAMAAFWQRARQSEARRQRQDRLRERERTRSRFVATTPALG